jgi:hypothetical protein
LGRAKEERGKADTRFCPVIDVEEVLPLGKAQKLLAFPSLIRIFAASMMIYACTDMQH